MIYNQVYSNNMEENYEGIEKVKEEISKLKQSQEIFDAMELLNLSI